MKHYAITKRIPYQRRPTRFGRRTPLIEVSQRDMKALIATLIHPPPLYEKLIQALKRHDTLIESHVDSDERWLAPFKNKRQKDRFAFSAREIVRVVQPYPPDRWHMGQTPAIGECGAVVHIDESDTEQAMYIVENVAPDGAMIWLAEFTGEEIELR
jgi:hypothetical protein